MVDDGWKQDSHREHRDHRGALPWLESLGDIELGNQGIKNRDCLDSEAGGGARNDHGLPRPGEGTGPTSSPPIRKPQRFRPAGAEPWADTRPTDEWCNGHSAPAEGHHFGDSRSPFPGFFRSQIHGLQPKFGFWKIRGRPADSFSPPPVGSEAGRSSLT